MPIDFHKEVLKIWSYLLQVNYPHHSVRKGKWLPLQKESRPFEKNIINAGSVHILQMMSKFILEIKNKRESNLIIKTPKYEEKVIILSLPSNFITAKRGLVAKNVNSKVVALSLWHFLEKLKVNFEASLCNRLGHLSERNWMKRNAGTRFSSSNSYQNFWTICRV